MNSNRTKHNMEGPDSDDSDLADSATLERQLRGLLTKQKRGFNKPGNLFDGFPPKVQQLRRSIVVRAFQDKNVVCSTPMPTEAERVFFDTGNSCNISPISVGEPENNKVQIPNDPDDVEETENRLAHNMPETDLITIIISDSSAEEEIENEKSPPEQFEIKLPKVSSNIKNRRLKNEDTESAKQKSPPEPFEIKLPKRSRNIRNRRLKNEDTDQREVTLKNITQLNQSASNRSLPKTSNQIVYDCKERDASSAVQDESVNPNKLSSQNNLRPSQNGGSFTRPPNQIRSKSQDHKKTASRKKSSNRSDTSKSKSPNRSDNNGAHTGSESRNKEDGSKRSPLEQEENSLPRRSRRNKSRGGTELEKSVPSNLIEDDVESNAIKSIINEISDKKNKSQSVINTSSGNGGKKSMQSILESLKKSSRNSSNVDIEKSPLKDLVKKISPKNNCVPENVVKKVTARKLSFAESKSEKNADTVDVPINNQMHKKQSSRIPLLRSRSNSNSSNVNAGNPPPKRPPRKKRGKKRRQTQENNFISSVAEQPVNPTEPHESSENESVVGKKMDDIVDLQSPENVLEKTLTPANVSSKERVVNASFKERHGVAVCNTSNREILEATAEKVASTGKTLVDGRPPRCSLTRILDKLSGHQDKGPPSAQKFEEAGTTSTNRSSEKCECNVAHQRTLSSMVASRFSNKHVEKMKEVREMGTSPFQDGKAIKKTGLVEVGTAPKFTSDDVPTDDREKSEKQNQSLLKTTRTYTRRSQAETSTGKTKLVEVGTSPFTPSFCVGEQIPGNDRETLNQLLLKMAQMNTPGNPRFNGLRACHTVYKNASTSSKSQSGHLSRTIPRGFPGNVPSAQTPPYKRNFFTHACTQTVAERETQTTDSLKIDNKVANVERVALVDEKSNSSRSSITDASEIIKELEKEKCQNMLLQGLSENIMPLNFSSSEDERLCSSERQNVPWRMNDNASTPPRSSSYKLGFLRSAREIEMGRRSKMNPYKNGQSSDSDSELERMPSDKSRKSKRTYSAASSRLIRTEKDTRATRSMSGRLHTDVERSSPSSDLSNLILSESDHHDEQEQAQGAEDEEQRQIREPSPSASPMAEEQRQTREPSPLASMVEEQRRTQEPSPSVSSAIEEQRQIREPSPSAPSAIEEQRQTRESSPLASMDEEQRQIREPSPSAMPEIEEQRQIREPSPSGSPAIEEQRQIREPSPLAPPTVEGQRRSQGCSASASPTIDGQRPIQEPGRSTTPLIQAPEENLENRNRSAEETEENMPHLFVRLNNNVHLISGPVEAEEQHRRTSSTAKKALNFSDDNTSGSINSAREADAVEDNVLAIPFYGGAHLNREEAAEGSTNTRSKPQRIDTSVNEEAVNGGSSQDNGGVRVNAGGSRRKVSTAKKRNVDGTPLNKQSEQPCFKVPKARGRPKKKAVKETVDVSSLSDSSQGVRRSARERRAPISRATHCIGVILTTNERDLRYYTGATKSYEVGEDSRSESKTKNSTKKKQKKKDDEEPESKKVRKSGKKKVGQRNRVLEVRLEKMDFGRNEGDNGNDTIGQNALGFRNDSTSKSRRKKRDATITNHTSGSESPEGTSRKRNKTNKSNNIKETVKKSVEVPGGPQGSNTDPETCDNSYRNVDIDNNNVPCGDISNPGHTDLHQSPTRFRTGPVVLDFASCSDVTETSSNGDEHTQLGKPLDKDSGRSTILKSGVSEDSPLRFAKPLAGRISKKYKKNDKISKKISRSISSSMEVNRLDSPKVDGVDSVSILQTSQSMRLWRSTLLEMGITDGEYIDFSSADHEALRMKYVDKTMTFQGRESNGMMVTDILKNGTVGSMGHLKLLPGCWKSLHVARKWHLFYFVIEGEGFIQVHNKRSTVGQYSKFLIPLDVEYAIHNTSSEESLVLGFVKVSPGTQV